MSDEEVMAEFEEDCRAQGKDPKNELAKLKTSLTELVDRYKIK